MATTTNYSWTTPDDTDLVKDGAAAIRTLGSSVDTTVKALNPETTLGDIAYRSSTANTNTRLALGTAGQVLTVNSGANAPEWATISAGGMTLLSTTTLSGVSTTISSISSAYTNLQIYIYGVTGNTSDAAVRVWFNADTGGGYATGLRYSGGTVTTFGRAADRLTIYNINTLRTNSTNAAVINISNYSDTSGRKPLAIYGYCIATGTTDGVINQAGYFQGTAAVSSVTFDYGGTNTFAGGTVLIYGVK
jgi:hypothetical protein